MEDNRFDLKIRSMLENGTEEVPAGLWSAIEGKLPAAPAKKAVLWWPWAAGAVAAAAAVALTVFFTGTSKPENGTIDIVNNGGQAMAESLTQETQAEEVAPAKDTYFATSADKAMTDSQAEVATDDGSSTASAQAEVATDDGNSTAEITTGDGSSQTSAQAEESAAEPESKPYVTDNFDESGTELASRVRRPTQITFSGDAGTNGSASGRGMANGAAMMKKPVVPSSTSVEDSGQSKYMIPVSAGLGVKIPLADRWSIGTGVNWSMMTRTFSGQYNKVDENGLVVSQASFSDIRNTQNYIGVPVNVYFSIIKKDFIDFYTYAGGSVNKCLSNKYTMHGLSETETYRSSQKGWQYSAGIGLGVEFIVARRVGFYIDPSLNWWFSDGKVDNIRSHQPLMMGLELGMRIRI